MNEKDIPQLSSTLLKQMNAQKVNNEKFFKNVVILFL